MLKINVKIKNERNPMVEHMRFKKSGSHGKSYKAVRRKEKQKFKEDMKYA